MEATLSNHPLARIQRGLTGMFNLRGRATRTDFFFAMIVMGIAATLVEWILEWNGWKIAAPYRSIEINLVWLLGAAFLVPRLHDQNRSGWFALILIPILAMDAYARYLFNIGQLPVPDLGFPYGWIRTVLSIVCLVLFLWPGTPGNNRYGPDPRELRPKRV